MKTKQVIVIRKDLNMRKGKMAAQAAHASMAFLLENAYVTPFGNSDDLSLNGTVKGSLYEIENWIQNGSAKIVVSADSLSELDEVGWEAHKTGLVVHRIVDRGDTEFNGVPTVTCVAIGPHFEDKFQGITDHLSLL